MVEQAPNPREKIPTPQEPEKGEKEEETEEKEVVVSLPKDATFSDLFNAIDNLEGDEAGSVNFEAELWDNFDEETAEAVLDLRETDKAAATGVIDFFREHGYSQKDIEAFLPIKFE